MCQKQCRDENGFKCHLTSDSHRRQMELFGQNPHRIVDGYSEEFHSCFMEHMRQACVLGNHVACCSEFCISGSAEKDVLLQQCQRKYFILIVSMLPVRAVP